MGQYTAPQYGNVLLMDPDMVNTNIGMTNSIPQYQDMFIFAELIGQRKGRSVIEISSQGNTSLQKTGMEENIVVNFIGNNQDSSPTNPNYLNFTTNWYENDSGSKTQFEGFGISSIKVTINSSYIPQVDIEFIDLRGVAFFNRGDSPYRILFDFPPPIFQLTLKGYYGMALSYKLHLVKYTSEFRSENGNFVINAQFVAITFAPLSDVLFRYIVNFPLMPSAEEGGISANPDPGQPPHNTYSLILKLKNLYSQRDDKINTTPEMTIYNNILLDIGHNADALGILSGFNSDATLKKDGNVPFMYMRNNSFAADNTPELIKVNGPADYDKYLQAFATNGLPENPPQRLFVAYPISENIPVNEVDTPQNDEKIRALNKLLNAYKTTELIGRTQSNLGSVVVATDITDASEFTSKNPAFVSSNPEITNLYTGIDVTNYYVKLYKQRTELTQRKTDSMNTINLKINDLVLKNLGMQPTIYNIFKVILNDVDKFFNMLRKTSYNAEVHHNTYIDSIINTPTYRDIKTNKVNNKKHIFSFPLVVKSEMVCKQKKESRTVPIELSATLPKPFPEILMLQEFIDTFTKQQKITELLNMKAEQNADGSSKWIPISPADSKLATSDMSTPYPFDSSDGGSQQQPINLSTDTRLEQIFTVLMERFYILSESSYPLNFYRGNDKNSQALGSKALVDLYSQSESLNLTASITNKEYANLLSTAAQRYGTQGHIDEFYTYLKTYIPKLYSFTPDNTPYFQISNGMYMYTDKSNPGFSGIKLYDGPIVTLTDTTGGASDNPIDKFQKTVNLGFWAKIKNQGAVLQHFYKFTEQNVFYIKDANESINDSAATRFIAAWVVAYVYSPKDDNPNDYELHFTNLSQNEFRSTYGAPTTGGIPQKTYNRIDIINTLNSLGNTGFQTIDVVPNPGAIKLESVGSIATTWIDQLARYDTEIYPTIINGYGDSPSPTFDARLSALILLSSFGYALSPFNIFPYDLNRYVFETPAAVEIPTFLPAYIGALINMNTTDFNNLKNFFLNGTGKHLDSSGSFIFADHVDVNKFLSETDKTTFQAAFTAFYGNNGGENTPFGILLSQLKLLYQEAQKEADKVDKNPGTKRFGAKRAFYQKNLNSSDGTYYPKILQPLITKTTLLNFSQWTFARELTSPKGYSSIETTNADSSKGPTNDDFFKGFFKNLASEIITQQSKITTQDQENKKLSGDDDILTQCYYSFKNINDKWLSGPLNTQSADANAGYPYGEVSTPGLKLIDNFVFVDRAMNPIGDTIINPEILINILDNPEVSVFSVLSQILSMNGFEFFPLQNFMKFENNEWVKSFEIDTSISVKTAPTFVCMYIGGGSSYPTGMYLYNQFDDDGINDLSTNTSQDFYTYSATTDSKGNPITNGCASVPSEDDQEAQNKKKQSPFPFRQVRAFRVKFGSQNQSMFKDIKIDSKEYPETNESLKILSNIAGDNKLQAPPPKGQNLYNLYENRAYKATITGLGNVMIQPTQYFQIENVPMYNGAYVILSVEHNVEPNKMTTSFSGMKILQYPVPRVKQSSAIFGFDGGNTDNTNPAIASASEVTVGVGTAGNPAQTYFNSMYDFKIQ